MYINSIILIHFFFRKDNDLIKLSKYADIFGIKEEVMDFVSMMYE